MFSTPVEVLMALLSIGFLALTVLERANASEDAFIGDQPLFAVEMGLTLCLSIDVGLRRFSMGREYFEDGWNAFDAVAIGFSAASSVILEGVIDHRSMNNVAMAVATGVAWVLRVVIVTRRLSMASLRMARKRNGNRARLERVNGLPPL
jgi:hypothetical protein